MPDRLRRGQPVDHHNGIDNGDQIKQQHDQHRLEDLGRIELGRNRHFSSKVVLFVILFDLNTADLCPFYRMLFKIVRAVGTGCSSYGHTDQAEKERFDQQQLHYLARRRTNGTQNTYLPDTAINRQKGKYRNDKKDHHKEDP